MSAETQRLATIITATAQFVDELARETGAHTINHNCITGEIAAHLRSYAELQQLPGKTTISNTESGGPYCYKAEKRVGEITFYVFATEAEVAGNEVD